MPAHFAPPPYYGQLFINDKNDIEGFSEGYYVNGENYAAAYASLLAIWRARQGLLPYTYKLVFARVSDQSIRGDSFTRPFDAEVNREKYFWNQLASDPQDAMAGNLCLWLRQEGTDPVLARAMRPLHGIPASLIDNTGTTGGARSFVPNAKWQSLFLKYEQELIASSKIVQVVGAASGVYSTSLVAAINNVENDITVVSAARFPKRNGFVVQIDAEKVKVVDGAGTNSWTVLRGQAGTTPAAHILGAAVTGIPLDTVNKVVIGEVQYPNVLRYRKVGRPFGLLRGRRAVTAST